MLYPLNGVQVRELHSFLSLVCEISSWTWVPCLIFIHPCAPTALIHLSEVASLFLGICYYSVSASWGMPDTWCYVFTKIRVIFILKRESN